jgi:hypothetical protein
MTPEESPSDIAPVDPAIETFELPAEKSAARSGWPLDLFSKFRSG